MKSLFNSVLETASLFKNCDGHLQSIILREECAELIVALSHFERNREGSFNEVLEELMAEVDKKYNKYHFLKSEVEKTMKKEVVIKITLTDDDITLDGQNLPELTENDIIDIIKVIVTLAKTMNLIGEGDSTDEDA